MTLVLLEHIVVTLVALGAATVIVRRVTGIVSTPGAEPKCASCPSAAAHRRSPQHIPLTVLRSADRR